MTEREARRHARSDSHVGRPSTGEIAITTADAPSPSPPTIWLLTDDKPGNRTQAVGVARALGLPAIEKTLGFNALQAKTAPRLGATLASLDEASLALIAPPWPDLVLGAGRRVVPVTRWIRYASGGRSRVVLIGRRTPGEGVDLTIRCAYFRQAPSANLLELALPPTQVDAATLARVRASEPDPYDGLTRPVCAFLVGGPTGRHAFDPDFAGRMAGEIAQSATNAGASLAIVTSRRTPADAVAAIRRAAPAVQVHEWRADAVGNPYLALLAHADLLAATGESESMLAEAAASGKPLTIYPLEARPLRMIARVRGAIAWGSGRRGLIGALLRKVMNDGWVSPRRDLASLHSMIEDRGWGRVFDGELNVESPQPFDEDEVVARRVLALLEPSPRTSS